MAQEIINGKVIGKRIVNTIGKLIHFNNIGTNLVSDNVEDAVKEINDTCVHLASNVTYVDPLPIDADILGGEYTAQSIKDMQTSLIGEQYDSTKSYTAGNSFVYKDKRYKVLNNCSGITPPNATYYEESSLNSDLVKYLYEPILVANSFTTNNIDDFTTMFSFTTKKGGAVAISLNVELSASNSNEFAIRSRVSNDQIRKRLSTTETVSCVFFENDLQPNTTYYVDIATSNGTTVNIAYPSDVRLTNIRVIEL